MLAQTVAHTDGQTRRILKYRSEVVLMMVSLNSVNNAVIVTDNHLRFPYWPQYNYVNVS